MFKMLEIYWLLAGIISVILFYFRVNDEKLQDKIEDVSWQVGISKDNIINIIYIILLLFGGIFLPLMFENKIKRKINENNSTQKSNNSKKTM